MSKKKRKKCTKCKGKGYVPAGQWWKQCPKCKGLGYVEDKKKVLPVKTDLTEAEEKLVVELTKSVLLDVLLTHGLPVELLRVFGEELKNV